MSTENLEKLTEKEATVLYWTCQGLKYEEIGLKMDYSVERITQFMAGVYIKLQFDPKTHWTVRRKLLKEYCPHLHALIEGNPGNLKNFPFVTEQPIPATEEPTTEPSKAVVPIGEITALVVTDEEHEDEQDQRQRGPIIVRPTPNTTLQANRRRRNLIIGGASGLVVLGVCLVLCVAAVLVYRNVSGHLASLAQTAAPILTEDAGKIRGAATDIAGARTLSVQQTQQAIPVATRQEVPVTTPSEIPLPTDIPTETSAPSVFVPPADGILFQDTFDNGPKDDWTKVTGNWITFNGRLTVVFEDYQYKWLSIGSSDWRNYRVQVNIKHPNGQLLLGVRDRSLGYKLDFMGRSCWVFIKSTDPDCITQLEDGVYGSINLELDVVNNEYVAIINGVEMQRMTIDGNQDGGVSLGIYCQQGFECPSYDNFKVTYLP